MKFEPKDQYYAVHGAYTIAQSNHGRDVIFTLTHGKDILGRERCADYASERKDAQRALIQIAKQHQDNL